MQTSLLISLVVNAVLCIALTITVRRLLSAYRWAGESFEVERMNAQKGREKYEHLVAEFGKLGAAVSKSLEAIRDDIDRNYEHTHDGHVLDMLAHDLGRQVESQQGVAAGVALDQWRFNGVQELGGKVAASNFMTLGELLEFGWHLHAKARARSGELCTVVSQPCDARDHARWLGKTLAIYERICGGKQQAIERMAVAVDAWRREHTLDIERHIQAFVATKSVAND